MNLFSALPFLHRLLIFAFCDKWVRSYSVNMYVRTMSNWEAENILSKYSYLVTRMCYFFLICVRFFTNNNNKIRVFFGGNWQGQGYLYFATPGKKFASFSPGRYNWLGVHRNARIYNIDTWKYYIIWRKQCRKSRLDRTSSTKKSELVFYVKCALCFPSNLSPLLHHFAWIVPKWFIF